jgi:dolichyl-phosphate-mannose--protein O-mannosyl transferase
MHRHATRWWEALVIAALCVGALLTKAHSWGAVAWVVLYGLGIAIFCFWAGMLFGFRTRGEAANPEIVLPPPPGDS